MQHLSGFKSTNFYVPVNGMINMEEELIKLEKGIDLYAWIPEISNKKT